MLAVTCRITSLSLCAFALGACGMGGGDSPSAPVPPPPSRPPSVLENAGGSPSVTADGPAATSEARVALLLYTTSSESTDVSIYAIDGITGALMLVAGSPFPADLASELIATHEPAGTDKHNATPDSPIVIDPSGQYLYAVNSGSDSISAYAIDEMTGAVALVNTVPAGDAPRSLNFVGLQ